MPTGVVCLLSALRFHNIGTQAPFEVWLAIDKKAWLPRIESPPVRIVRFSRAVLTAGIEEHRIEKVPVRIYSPAKQSLTASGTGTNSASTWRWRAYVSS